MLSLSAKTVNLSARPSPSVSSQMTMRSRPSPSRLQLVGIVDRLGDPQPAALVPGHAIGLPICGSATNSSSSKPTGVDMCFIDSAGVERLLHLADRLAVRAPAFAGGIERQLRLDVLERLDVGCERRHLRRVAVRPGLGRVVPQAQRMPRSTRLWKPGLPQVRSSWPQAV